MAAADDEQSHVLGLLRRARLPQADEPRLRDAIASLLERERIRFEREAWIGEGDRIDFLLASGTGIECKARGAKTAVLRQLMRYAESDFVSRLLLATSRMQHARMPDKLRGKPLAVYVCWSPP